MDRLASSPTSPTTSADDLGITDEALLTCGVWVAARNTQSLDSISPTGVAPLVERIGSEDPSFLLVEDLTQAEVGRRLGISHMQVSRRLAVVLGQLRRRTGTRETAEVPSS